MLELQIHALLKNASTSNNSQRKRTETSQEIPSTSQAASTAKKLNHHLPRFKNHFLKRRTEEVDALLRSRTEEVHALPRSGTEEVYALP